MEINYSLYPNRLSDEDYFIARVIYKETIGLDDIVDEIVNQGSTVCKADILAVLDDSVKVIERQLLFGRRVNFGNLVYLSPSVKGTFADEKDPFDKSRHKVIVKANPSASLRNKLQHASVKRIETVQKTARINSFMDSGSGETNGTITAVNIGTLHGKRMSYNPEEADEGIYFIAADNSETKVTIVQRNKPSELVFLNPTSLTSGNYFIGVRNRLTTDQLHIHRFNKTLTVA